MQYAGSLIGRQFKALVETNIFHVQSLVSDLKFKAWKAVGKLSALLWVPKIRNPMEYQVFVIQMLPLLICSLCGHSKTSKLLSEIFLTSV
jgi:hypothetical protein